MNDKEYYDEISDWKIQEYTEHVEIIANRIKDLSSLNSVNAVNLKVRFPVIFFCSLITLSVHGLVLSMLPDQDIYIPLGNNHLYLQLFMMPQLLSAV